MFCEQAAKTAGAAFVEEVDEEAAAPAAAAAAPAVAALAAASVHRLAAPAEGEEEPAGLQLQRRPAPKPAPAAAAAAAPPAQSSYESRRAHIAQALAATNTGSVAADEAVGGGNADATAAVLADLAVLQAARGGGGGGDEAGDEAAAEWRPPEGQRGDGRTRLNDQLGY